MTPIDENFARTVDRLIRDKFGSQRAMTDAINRHLPKERRVSASLVAHWRCGNVIKIYADVAFALELASDRSFRVTDIAPDIQRGYKARRRILPTNTTFNGDKKA